MANKVSYSADGKKIAMINPEGESRYVEKAYYQQMLKAGWQPEPEEVTVGRLTRDRYEQMPMSAFMAGIAEGGIPLVGGHVARLFLPPDVSSEKLAEHNPAAAMTGEALGFAGSMAVPVGGLANIAAKGGKLAGAGVRALTKGAESTAAKLGAKALAKGAEFGTEGAIAGGLMEANRAQADSDDHIIARAWGGAVDGGIGGVALGAAGTAAARTLGIVTKPVKSAVVKARSMAMGRTALEAAEEGVVAAEGAVTAARKAADDKLAQELAIADQRLKAGDYTQADYDAVANVAKAGHAQELAGVSALEKEAINARNLRKNLTSEFLRDRVELGNFLGRKVGAASFLASGAAGVATGAAASALPGGTVIGGLVGRSQAAKLIKEKVLDGWMRTLHPTGASSRQAPAQFTEILKNMRQSVARDNKGVFRKGFDKKSKTMKDFVSTEQMAGEWAAEGMERAVGRVDDFMAKHPAVVSAGKVATAMIEAAPKGAAIAEMSRDEIEDVARAVHVVSPGDAMEPLVMSSVANMAPEKGIQAAKTVDDSVARLQQTSPIKENTEKSSINTLEQIRFRDRLIAQTDPELALDLINQGKGSADMVDQLKQAFPELYKEMAQKAEFVSRMSKQAGVQYDTKAAANLQMLMTGTRASRHAQQLQAGWAKQAQQKIKGRNVKMDNANKARSFADSTAARMGR